MRNGEITHGASVIEDWLEAQHLTDLEDGEFTDEQIDALCVIGRLAVRDTPMHDLAESVRQAREAGWDWAPIAMLLGLPAAEARRRFTNAVIPRPRNA